MDNAPRQILGLLYPLDLSSPAWSTSVASGLSRASCFGPSCRACSPPSLAAAAEVSKRLRGAPAQDLLQQAGPPGRGTVPAAA